MCVLCGGYVSTIHWTDQKKKTDQDSSSYEAGERQRDRMRERLQRVRLANELLGLYGLRLEDWGGVKYVIKDKKGRQEVIQDFGALWEVVERWLGKSLDPLDSALWEALDKKT